MVEQGDTAGLVGHVRVRVDLVGQWGDIDLEARLHSVQHLHVLFALFGDKRDGKTLRAETSCTAGEGRRAPETSRD